LLIIFAAVAELCGTNVYSQAITDQTVLAARMNALGGLYEGLLRSPELADLLIEASEELMGTAVRRPALPCARGTHGGTAQSV
jgi:hypothetical protein